LKEPPWIFPFPGSKRKIWEDFLLGPMVLKANPLEKKLKKPGLGEPIRKIFPDNMKNSWEDKP